MIYLYIINLYIDISYTYVHEHMLHVLVAVDTQSHWPESMLQILVGKPRSLCALGTLEASSTIIIPFATKWAFSKATYPHTT